jgi:hypothetical protein
VTYNGDDQPLTERHMYAWFHRLSAVVTSLIDAGLRLDWPSEHEAVPWRAFPMLVPTGDGMYRVPAEQPPMALAYSLQATKPG